MEFIGSAIPLTEAGLRRSMDILDIGAAEVWAVLSVETTGCGFLSDRRPKILFERHIFHERTGGVHDDIPEISNRRAGGYGSPGSAQYLRLSRAMAIDGEAALESCSWGIGQVMGFNAVRAGFSGPRAMILSMCESEDCQMEAMAQFIAGDRNMAAALRDHEWGEFARRYNGPAYAINQYDSRLRQQHRRWLAGPLPDLEVRAAQIRLMFAGHDPGPIDGLLGRKTISAICDYQEDMRIPVSEILDQDTLRNLAG